MYIHYTIARDSQQRSMSRRAFSQRDRPANGNMFISILRLNNVLSKRALPRGKEISTEGQLRKWSAAIPAASGKAELFISRRPRSVRGTLINRSSRETLQHTVGAAIPAVRTRERSIRGVRSAATVVEKWKRKKINKKKKETGKAQIARRGGRRAKIKAAVYGRRCGSRPFFFIGRTAMENWNN